MDKGLGIRGLFGKSVLMILVFILMITGLVGQPIGMLTQTMPTNNIAYAEESEEDTEEGESEGEDEDEARGSSSTNLMNVLDMEKSMEAHYMTNLETVLGYDEDVHNLVTLAALQSETFKGGSPYSRIYSGGFNDESIETDKITNTQDLFDKLDLIKADSEELQKANGINESMIEDIFGKKESELDSNEKDMLKKLENITNDEDEREKAMKDFESKGSKAIGSYICRTGMLSTGYGGALSPFLINGWNNVTGSSERFMHSANSEYDLGLKGNPGTAPVNGDAVQPCLDNINKFYEKDTPHMNGAITTLQNNLVKHEGKFNDDLALNIIDKNLRSNSGKEPYLYSSKYPELHKPVKSDGDGGFTGAIKSSSKFVLEKVKWYAKAQVEELQGKRQIKGGALQTYGYDFRGDTYVIAGEKLFTKTEFSNMISSMNDVWGTSYTVSDFHFKKEDSSGWTSGAFEGREFANKGAYDTLNKYLTINLISSQYYARDVEGFDEYKEEQYGKYITPLANDPYILYKKHIEKGMAHDAVENVRGLGWMPAFYDKNYDGESTEELEKANKDFDGTTVPSTAFLTSEERTRAMKVVDLLGVEHDGKYSPLASWQGDKNNAGLSMGHSEKYFYKLGRFSPMELDGESAKLREDMKDDVAGTYAKAFKEASMAKTTNKEHGLGIDNYGNLIVANDLALVIPYWHMMGGIEGTIYSTPLYKSTDEEISADSYTDTKLSYNKLYEMNTAYASEETIKKAIKENDLPTLRKVASNIVDQTKDNVKSHNEKFLESMNDANDNGTGELYITEASVTDSLTTDLESMYDEYTDADIVDKIAMMLKYGAWDFIRLTFVGFFVDFYNTVVYNFTISEVFYATTMVDSNFFTQLIPNMTLLIGALTMIYVAFSVYMLYMGRVTLKRIIFMVFGFTFVLIIPFLYSMIVNYGINEVSDSMLGKQTRQMMLVDTWTNDIKISATSNSEESRLYGYGNTIDFRDPGQDYIVTFHTTTSAVNGCDIVNPDSQFCINYATDSETGKPLTDWKSSDLVTVNVSMYDMFGWLKSVEEEHRMSSSANATIGADFTSDDGVTGTLFEYLDGLPEAEEKGYSGISEYQEYSVNTSVDYMNYEGDPSITEKAGETVTSSDLLARIYYNANRNDDLINSMDSLAYLYEEGIKNKDITQEQKEFIIRDLSMTKNSRMAINGGNSLSRVSKAINDDFSLNLEVPGKGDNSHSGDIFNLYNSISKLDVYRPDGGYYGQLEGEVFDLNKQAVNIYFTDFAVVRSSMEGGATNPSYKRSEAMVMGTVLWMNVNKKYDIELFPRNYDGSSVSLDNYMRVAFIPIGMFGNPADTSSEVIGGEYGSANVGEYLSLRENLITLFFFSIMILLMLGYGLLKWAMIHFALLILTIYGFVKNYLIGSEINKDSKFKLGTLMTYGIFIVMNIAFNTMWWIFGYAINNSYAANDGQVGYPATAIHSVVASIVLLVCIRVIISVISKIRKDPADMGGSEYQKDLDNLRGRIKGMMNGTFRQKGNNKESVYMRDSKREGRNGRVPKDEVNRSNKQGNENLKNNLSAGAGIAASNIMNALDNSSKVNVSPNSLSSKFSGAVGARPKDRHLSNTLNKVDNIDTNNNSILSKDEEKNLDNLGMHGSKIGSSGTGNNVHVLGFGKSKEGKAQAKMLQDYLSKQGLKASIDNKGNVMFDAGKNNLETPAGRKVMLGGFMHNMADKIKDKDNATISDVDNSSLMNNNYGYNMTSDGNVDIKVGGKDGVHHSVLADTITKDWFKDKFTVSKAYSGKGKEGNIVLKPKEESLEAIDESVSQLFVNDTRGRTREGYEPRQDSKNDKSLKFNGNSESSRKVIQDTLSKEGKNAKGMALHGNSLVFSSKDKEHKRIIKNIRQGLGDSHESDVQTAKMIATKVGNYVVNGEGNKQEPKLDIFNRKTKKNKDETGNVGYDIHTAQSDITTMTDTPTNNNITSLEGNKSMVNIDKKGKKSKDNVETLRQMPQQQKQQILNKESKINNVEPMAINSDVGVQENIKHSSMSNHIKGSGMSHSKVDVNTGNNKSMMRNVGILGGEKTTTAYGGDKFGDKLQNFNSTLNVLGKHEKEFGDLVSSKDNVLNAYTTHVGGFGSQSRVKNQMDFIRGAEIDTATKSKVEQTYNDLTRNYNSGDITTESYNKELKTLNGTIEKLLKDKGLYDTSIISALNKKDANKEDGKGLSDKDKKELEKYRKSKQSLTSKGVDKSVLEKMNGKSYNELKQFKAQGNKLKPNQDNKTFDIKGNKELSNKETEKIYNMIKDIS